MPGTIAAGGAAVGVAVTSCDMVQPADEAAGAGDVVNVWVAAAVVVAAGTGAIDIGDPAAAEGAPAGGWAGVAAAVVAGASALKDADVVVDVVGDTGKLIGGCGVTAPDEPDVAKVVVVVPVDVVAVLAGSVDAGAEDGAAFGADVKVAGVAMAGADVSGVGAIEPNVEPDVPVVDAVTTGAAVDAGVEAPESEP